MLARVARALPFALALALPLASPLAAQDSTATPRPAPSAAEPPRASALPAYRAGIDVTDYDLTLDLPDTGRTIRGSAVLTVRRTARVDTLVLDLVARLRVDGVRVDGHIVEFRRSGDSLLVPLPRGRDRTVKVSVAYGGAPEDGLIIRTDSAGRWTAFGDNWPNRARNWIPSVDHPSDKATVSWTVRAPSRLTVIANGALVARQALDERGRPGWTETRWRESRPVPTYVMVIAAAPLARYDLGQTACGYGSTPDGCVPQSVYVFPEARGTLPGPFGAAPDIVRYFAGLVGPFPYEKLAHLQSATRFGGMENASAIFYAENIVARDRMTDRLIAHETAHQWFGDAVTEAAWPHVWLSEGFATYFALLWTRHAHGESAFRTELAELRTTLLADTGVVIHRPVIDTIETNLVALLNHNSYDKGGFVLHMLHRQLGDSAFFGALRAYQQAHRHGTALTADLQRAMEEASGQRLGWFFDQWLRRPGFAELTGAWRYDSTSRRVTVTITQSERFGAYRLPLTIAVTDAGGTVRRARVELPAARETRVVLPMRFTGAPASIALDPDGELLASTTTSPE